MITKTRWTVLKLHPLIGYRLKALAALRRTTMVGLVGQFVEAASAQHTKELTDQAIEKETGIYKPRKPKRPAPHRQT